jgi:hypothetical protein
MSTRSVLSAAVILGCLFVSQVWAAKNPDPPDGADHVSPSTNLSWSREHTGTNSYRVYFGTDEQAVADGTVPTAIVSSTSYSPPSLDPGSTYFWRVDEAYGPPDFTIWVGDVWSFRTQAAAPDVTTSSATDVTATSAVLWAEIVDDGGETCEYRFRYGPKGEPAGKYVETGWTGGASSGDTVHESIGGLTSGTEYVFEVEARNTAAGCVGTQSTFTTLARITLGSTIGGSVILPGEGAFSYARGAELPVKAQASDPSYAFVQWFGPAAAAGKVADTNAPETTVIVDGDNTLLAQFEQYDPNAGFSEEELAAINDLLQEYMQREIQKSSEQAAQIKEALAEEAAKLENAFKSHPDYPEYKKEHDDIVSKYEKSSQTSQDYEDMISALEALATQYRYIMDAAIDQANIDMAAVRAKVEGIVDWPFEVRPDLTIVYVPSNVGIGPEPRLPHECRDVTELDPPGNLEASDGDFLNKVKVSWDPVNCADGYLLSIRQEDSCVEEPSDDPDAVKWIKQPANQEEPVVYDHTDAVQDVTYCYQVEAVTYVETGHGNETETIEITSDPSNCDCGWRSSLLWPPLTAHIVCPPIGAPGNLRASSDMEYCVKLEWNSVMCAEDYLVYRGETSNFNDAELLGLPWYLRDPVDVSSPMDRILDDIQSPEPEPQPLTTWYNDYPPARPGKTDFWYWVQVRNTEHEYSDVSGPVKGSVTGPASYVDSAPYDMYVYAHTGEGGGASYGWVNKRDGEALVYNESWMSTPTTQGQMAMVASENVEPLRWGDVDVSAKIDIVEAWCRAAKGGEQAGIKIVAVYLQRDWFDDDFTVRADDWGDVPEPFIDVDTLCYVIDVGGDWSLAYEQDMYYSPDMSWEGHVHTFNKTNSSSDYLIGVGLFGFSEGNKPWPPEFFGWVTIPWIKYERAN